MSPRAPARRLAALLAPAFALLLGALPAQADDNDYVAIERGRYLATVGDCSSCHLHRESPYAGGRGIETPFGTINAPNITPDPETGLGRWTREDFARALQQGISRNGGHLYPALPYPWFTRISREDSDAIYAYLRTVPPVSNAVNRDTLPFPFSIRAVMRVWNGMFFEPGRFQPVIGRTDEWNRGAYLVEGLGHCGACHTPVNALGGSRRSQSFAGQALQGWYAPNIGGSSYQGIGEWGVDDVVQYLRTGANGWTRASGPMAEVVQRSTSRMTEADLRSIAVYLRDQPGRGPATAPPALAADSPRMRTGQAIYVDNCSACHRRDGQGVESMIPSLASNQIAVQAGPETLIRLVLSGSRPAATDAEPTAPAMPAFGWRLNDAQVADVVTYLRNSWGNAAPPVEASVVQTMRRQLAARGE
nr:cytochrome c [uncultured Roseococcus sp.]